MSESKPGYYAVIPADVRYDKTIPANAKLLYGEISALIGAEGFCYASNQYFAGLFNVAEETISRLLAKLEKAGHIIRELVRDSDGQIVQRKIFLRVSISDAHPLDDFVNTSPQKDQEGIDEKVKETNLSITNNKKKNKKEKGRTLPKLSRSEVDERFASWIIQVTNGVPASDHWIDALTKSINLFLDHRAASGNPISSQPAVTALCNKLMRLSGGSLAVVIEMLETAVERGWRSVYAPKGGGVPLPDPPREEKRWL